MTSTSPYQRTITDGEYKSAFALAAAVSLYIEGEVSLDWVRNTLQNFKAVWGIRE